MSIQHETLDLQKQTHAPEMKNQQAHVPVHQNVAMMKDQQMNAQATTNVMSDAKRFYLEQTAQMEDTARLGKKSFKSNTAEKKKRNERIDRAKIMTERATAYTLDVYDQLKDVNAVQYNPKTANLTYELADLEAIPFAPQMFFSSTIRDKLKIYLNWIKKYDHIKMEAEENKAFAGNEEFKARVAALEPIMSALRYRLQVYCEQNRVSLDGTILEETKEASQLTDAHITGWYELVQENFVRLGAKRPSSADKFTDEERLRLRQMREEAGRAEVAQHTGALQRTRDEAISTESDRQSQKSREELRALNRKLYECGLTDVVKIVHEYVVGTRYTVGYTEERKRLMKAIEAVDAALIKVEDVDAHETLEDMKEYFDRMTNGTLVIPEDAQILDCTKKKLEETGGSGGGSTRNDMIRTAMHWSDQTDTPLFSHEPVVNDLKQRLVSNCYMVAGTTGLVHLNPALLKECIKDNSDGTVTVRLYDYVKVENKQQSAEQQPAADVQEDQLEETDQKFEHYDELKAFEDADEVDQYELRPVYIKVTKEIPRIAGTDALSAGALWMQMIEKACAYLGRSKTPGGKKRHGYQSLWYGEGGEFLERLLGISRQVVNKDTQADQDALFEGICHAAENRIVYHAGTYNEKNAAGENDTDGLNTGHAYAVLGGKVENGQRYVLLRNPYSTNSLKYQEDGGRETTGSSLSVSSDETYGQFYMKFEEFVRDFNTVSFTDLKRYNNH